MKTRIDENIISSPLPFWDRVLYFYEFPVQFHFTCRYTRGRRRLAGFSSSRGPQDAHSLSGDASGLLRPRTAPGRGSRPRKKPRTARAQSRPFQGCVYNLQMGGEGSQLVAPLLRPLSIPSKGFPRPPDRAIQPHDTRGMAADPVATSLDTRIRQTREWGRPGPPPLSSPGTRGTESGGKGSKERTPGGAVHGRRAKDGAAPATPKSTGLREGPERRLPPGRPFPARRPATHGPAPSPSVVRPQRPPAAPAHLPLRLVGRGGRWSGEPGSHSPASRGVGRQRRAAGGRHRPAASLRSGAEPTLRSPAAGGRGCNAISTEQRGSRAGGRGRLSRSAPRPGVPAPGARAWAREGRAASAEGPALLPALLPDSATAPCFLSEPAPRLS